MPRTMTNASVGVDRERARRGVPIAVIARERGVSRQTMRKAIYGLTYQNCEVAALNNPQSEYKHPNRKLTDDEVRALRADRRGDVVNGVPPMSWRKLAAKYRVSVRTACLIYSGEHYSDVV